MFVHGKYFYGNEISEYGQKYGYVDYMTLAKAFDLLDLKGIIMCFILGFNPQIII